MEVSQVNSTSNQEHKSFFTTIGTQLEQIRDQIYSLGPVKNKPDFCSRIGEIFSAIFMFFRDCFGSLFSIFTDDDQEDLVEKAKQETKEQLSQIKSFLKSRDKNKLPTKQELKKFMKKEAEFIKKFTKLEGNPDFQELIKNRTEAVHKLSEKFNIQHKNKQTENK